MITQLFIHIIKNSVITSIFIVVFLFLKGFLLNKYSFKFNYYIWIVLLFKMIYPFNIPIYLKNEVFLNTSKKIYTSFTDNSLNTISFNPTHTVISTLSIVWIIGVLLLFIYNSFVYIRYKSKMYINSTQITDSEINSIFMNQLNALRIKRNINLRFTSEYRSPFGIGIFSPTIYLPNKEYENNELALILKHELIHFKRFDLLYKKILVFIKCIYWFNPLVYKLNKLIELDCELSCDEIVIKNSDLDTRKNYALALLSSIKFSSESNCNKLIMNFNNKDLKRRIECMLNIKKRKKGRILGVLIITVIGGTFFSFNSFVNATGNIDPIIKKYSRVYGINEYNQTYGSGADANRIENEPDLILVETNDGNDGYVLKHELYDTNNQPNNPEEAMAYMDKLKREGPRTIPVYDKDGKTIIGSYTIG